MDAYDSMLPPVNNILAQVPGMGEPTPLVGPGNTPNPPIGLEGGHNYLPDPMVMPAPFMPENALTAATAGLPAAMRGQINAFCIPNGGEGSVLNNFPLIPGAPSNLVPEAVPGAMLNSGLGTVAS